MSADIEFLCSASQSCVGAVTIVEDRWAYCSEGADGDHEWQRIKPTPMSELARMWPHARQNLLMQIQE